MLFWLSLTPFTTAWMGENHFAPMPVAVYGVGLLMNAIAYTILVRMLIRTHGRDSEFAARIGGDIKGYISLVLYILAVGLSFVNVVDLAGDLLRGRDDLVHSGSPLRALSRRA